MSEITIHKSKYNWDKRYPYKVMKGDCVASFKTRKQAQTYANKVMPYVYVCPITFQSKIGKRRI